ncbi:MAG: penicillin-binding protein 1A [Gammaproteobacteria bacterium]
MNIKFSGWLRLFLLITLGVLLSITSLNLYIYEKLPQATEIEEVKLQIPLKIYTEDGKLIGEFGEKRRSALSFNEIPDFFVKAILAAEDDNFFNHDGVSYLALLRSFYRLAVSGRVKGGGSTITMQVAGNYLTGRDVTILRKVKDIFLSYRLENNYSKEEIFEFYVNRIFLGNRAYGIAAASEVYYGKSLKDLNLAQWAMIAALPKAPSSMNPLSNPKRALIRRNWILGRMLQLNYIHEEEYELAVKAPISASYHGLVSEVSASYFAENIRRYMIQEYGLAAYRDGFEVFTTINSKWQESANLAIRSGLEEYDKRHGFRDPINISSLFGEELFTLNLEQIMEEIKSSRESLDGSLTELDELPYERVFNFLSQLHSSKDRFPAVVIGTKDYLTILSYREEFIKIKWNKEEYFWIRPYINQNQRGRRASSFSDFLNKGDLVWIRRDTSNESLSLFQIPEVQGSLVALEPNSGSVKALVGGYDFYLSKFDRATQSSPLLGSNFKPFLYAAAFAKGYKTSDLINDAPIVFEDEALEEKWRPKNSSGIFYGPTRLREGLLQSRNLVSIRLLRRLGIDNSRSYAENFGFELNRLPSDLSLALGTSTLSPLMNASAYSVFANGGKKVEPYFINRIQDGSGQVLFKKESPTPSQAIDPRVAFIIKDILQEASVRGTAKKISSLKRNDLAGKTGTTNDADSTWFTGFNDSIVSTVWVGFDRPKSLGNNEFGSTTALPIWMDFVKPIISELPKSKALPPKGLVSVRVNKENGKRAKAGERNSMFEYFLEEHLPE